LNILEKGVLPSSCVYFSTTGNNELPWAMAVRCTGLYQCSAGYRVERHSYDSALLMEVVSGSGYVWLGQEKRSLRAGDFLLLNCYEPHVYGTEAGWDILWAHFFHGEARAIAAGLSDPKRVIHPGGTGFALHERLGTIYQLFSQSQPKDDARLHLLITDLATAFYRSYSAQTATDADRAAAYMAEHMRENTPNAVLAGIIHRSESQFIRHFRHEKGMTPHQYLLNIRLNAVKYYVATTGLPLSHIAEECGFNDASSLVNSFKQHTGLTPRQYGLKMK
jgi:AraC-like DNA-binding protein